MICAACGGVRNPDPRAVSQDPAVAENRAARTRVAFSADALALIASYEKSFGQAAVESCLQEWSGGEGASDPGAQVFKPDFRGFRSFLAECLGAPEP